MTALFSDWDLGGDDAELSALLISAMDKASDARIELAEFDSTADDARERGERIRPHLRMSYAQARARHAHYTRQVCRLRETLEKRENERLAAEKRNKARASIRLKP